MSATNILDRFIDDYEGGHPVEYALPPSPKKLKEIEKVMGGVSRKVRSNAKKGERSFRGAMKRNGFNEQDIDIIRNDYKRYIREHQGVDDGYAMAIDETALNRVMDGDGQFKNLFQVGRGNGYVDLDMRADVSKRNFGTRFREKNMEYEYDAYDDNKVVVKKMPKSLLNAEKYGFHPMYSDPNSTSGYGHYRIEFNPENMKNRTTMSMDDSLDSSHYPVLLEDEDTWGGFVANIDEEHPYRSASRRLSMNYGPSGYRELQFHGPVGLDDVDRVVVPTEDGTRYDNVEDAIAEIPDQWKLQAEINHFDIVDDYGNVLYQWGSR